MSENEQDGKTSTDTEIAKTDAANGDLPPAAIRALREAEDRRQAEKAAAKERARREIDGRGGLDPVRYGDWEVKGLTSDF